MASILEYLFWRKLILVRGDSIFFFKKKNAITMLFLLYTESNIFNIITS